MVFSLGWCGCYLASFINIPDKLAEAMLDPFQSPDFLILASVRMYDQEVGKSGEGADGASSR